MRELTRFRDDFQDNYSLRSKFLKTANISDQLTNLISTNFDILKQEKKVLDIFKQQKSQLQYKRLGTQNRIRESQEMIVERYYDTQDISKLFHERSIFTQDKNYRRDTSKDPSKSGIKTRLINNVLCFVHYFIRETDCLFTVHSKLRPEPQVIVVPKGDDFNLLTELGKLQFCLVPKQDYNQLKPADDDEVSARIKREQGNFQSVAVLHSAVSPQHTWIDAFEEGLFYRVPTRVVSYVEGAGVCMVEVEFNENADNCVFKINSAADEETFEVKVPLPNLFKQIHKLGMSAELFDEELYAIKYRHRVILKVISTYIRRNL